jgi:hypothetical protein|tara:strand:- start:145 stop:903 length:759 start_codon:yes stop_codon:yes gene_type:complete
MLILAKNKVTPEQLEKVPTPNPTDTHTPIPHALLADRARNAISQAGFVIAEEEHAIARGGQRYFGGFSLTGDDLQGDDRKLVLGLRNAHDKSFAASVCIGNQMMVCDNLCFSSDVKLARRHTVNILRDLNTVLSSAVSRVTSHWFDMGKRISSYKETELSKERASDLVVDLAEMGAFPARSVYKAVQEFRNPRHEEFKGGSLWTLYNGVTEHLKGGDLSKLPQRTMTTQSIFDKIAGHTPEIVEAEVVALPA